jgi:hypothetical protein
MHEMIAAKRLLKPQSSADGDLLLAKRKDGMFPLMKDINIEVARTDNSHVAQPLTRPARCSLLTFVVVRVQDPATTLAFRYSFAHSGPEVTFGGPFDTHPNHERLLLHLFDILIFQLVVPQTSRTAAQAICIAQFPSIRNSIQIFTCRQVCGKSRGILVPSRVHENVIIPRWAVHFGGRIVSKFVNAFGSGRWKCGEV